MQPAVKSERVKIAPTDEMLIERTRLGQLEALEQLFVRYSNPTLEYLFILTGDKSFTETALLTVFFRFYRHISNYDFDQKLFPQLLFQANLLVKENETPNRSLDALKQPFLKIPIEDRILYVLIKKYSLNLGAVSWILQKPAAKLIDRFNEISGAFNDVEFPEMPPETMSPDYRVVLRSRLERSKQENKKIATILSVSSVLVVGGIFLLSFFLIVNSMKGTPPLTQLEKRSDVPLSSDMKEKDTSLRSQAKPASPVLLYTLQKDRRSFFVKDKSFAQESMQMVAGRGKTVAIEYELFSGPSKAGLEIVFDNLDVSPYQALSFWCQGDPEYGFPQALFIHLKKGNDLVFEFRLAAIGDQWQYFEIPFNFQTQTVIDSLQLGFSDDLVKEVKSGRVFFDQLAFKRIQAKR